MPLLKSQIIFIKKGSIKKHFQPIYWYILYNLQYFPCFLIYKFVTNWLSCKGEENNNFYMARTQDFKLIFTFVNMCHWLDLLKHSLKWIQDCFQVSDEKAYVRIKILYLCYCRVTSIDILYIKSKSKNKTKKIMFPEHLQNLL